MHRPVITHQARNGLIVAASVFVVYFVLGRHHYYQYLNYTFLIGTALLHGHLGVDYAPAWLNELVPVSGHYYSVFPLGAVLTVLPASLWALISPGGAYPVTFVMAAAAAACAGLAYGLTLMRPDFSTAKRIGLSLWLVAGTWFLTNTVFAGAWQIALEFAVAGQLGALFFTVVRPNPLAAGACFAVAFGNRTEVLLTAPVFMWFLIHDLWPRIKNPEIRRVVVRKLTYFCVIPLLLGIATLVYNVARFGSPIDFGYARIPGILNEPLYRNGIFSLLPVTQNAQQMLWQGWRHVSGWPYWVPTGFSGSIIIASPFLLLLARRPTGNRLHVALAWVALVAITASLWVHGNPGGWQFSYRYAEELLPWAMLILIEYLPARITASEAVLWTLSIGINAFATYLFLWTQYVTP